VPAKKGIDWRIEHDVCIAFADGSLEHARPAVRVLGMDETRQGKGRYETNRTPGTDV